MKNTSLYNSPVKVKPVLSAVQCNPGIMDAYLFLEFLNLGSPYIRGIGDNHTVSLI